MRICMMYDGDYPWDVRVEKIATTLSEHDHDLHLICRNLQGRPREERLGRWHVHRLRPARSPRLNYVMSFPAFLNPFWLAGASRIVAREKSQLILVRDLPLALCALLVARAHRVPVILDMAENYPAMVRDIWRFEDFKAVNLLVRNPTIVDWVERMAVRRSERVLVVTEESKARLVDQYSISPSRVDIVSNTPRLADLRRTQPAKPQVGKGMNLVYVGGLEPSRNLGVVLRGLATARDEADCSLTIVGQGTGETRLKRLTRELALDGKVTFSGWVEHAAVAQHLDVADVGVIPHAVTRHTNSTVPNKLFDYMGFSLPVLASDTASVQRIVEAEGCGVIYRHDHPGDFVRALQKLQNPETRREMGARGRSAVATRYNWETDSKVLLGAVAKCGPR